MLEVISNKVLLTNIITKNSSRYSCSELDYDYWEVMVDAAKLISEYWTSQNVDKRVIAVGADFYIHVWDLYVGDLTGWKEQSYISGGMYAQMVVDILKPQKALISSPDRHFDLIALLASRGCSLTFLNNECLFNFENFIRDLPSYPFTIEYDTIDYQDLLSNTAPEYDFMHMQSSDAIVDPDLIDAYDVSLNSGGVIYVPFVNEDTRLYSADYHVEPVVSVLDAFLSKENMYSYHIPNTIGFQIVVKK